MSQSMNVVNVMNVDPGREPGLQPVPGIGCVIAAIDSECGTGGVPTGPSCIPFSNAATRLCLERIGGSPRLVIEIMMEVSEMAQLVGL